MHRSVVSGDDDDRIQPQKVCLGFSRSVCADQAITYVIASSSWLSGGRSVPRT
jgi:hypothetical protein